LREGGICTDSDIFGNQFKVYPSCNGSLDSDWNSLRHKYVRPDSETIYNKMVEMGTLLYIPTIVKEILKEYYEDIEIEVNYYPRNGPDMVVCTHGRLLLKMEVLNWWIRTYLTQKRMTEIRDNLRGAPFKVLCISHPLNFRPLSRKVKAVPKGLLKGIHVFYTGYQVLPITYYEHFEKLDPQFTLFRAIYGEKTTNHQKILLKSFFEKIGLI
jgi:hypothetical protein